MSEVDDVKERTSLRDIVAQDVTWDKKKTSEAKQDYWACCPFHGEKRPSFHVEELKNRYYCFGCGASGDVFKYLQETRSWTFKQALEYLRGDNGCTPAYRKSERSMQQQRNREVAAARDKKNREDYAHGIWNQTLPLKGTPAHVYLQKRGIDFLEQEHKLHGLRYHPGLKYKHADVDTVFPALVCGVQHRDSSFAGIWRIYVTEEGEKPPVENSKLGLGNISGGAVRLAPAGPVLGICEGVETGLGAMMLNSYSIPVWAALAGANMAELNIPRQVEKLIIFGDGDKTRFHQRTGKAYAPGEEYSNKAKEVFERKGLEVEIRAPELGDWLDVYQAANDDEGHERTIQYTLD